MITTIPPVGILIDLPFGVLMWTSVVALFTYFGDERRLSFFILRVLRGVNSPIHRAINLVKPNFIITRLAPLYSALVLFILRYYLLPLLVGFDVWNFYRYATRTSPIVSEGRSGLLNSIFELVR